jgi:hypothetical protein
MLSAVRQFFVRHPKNSVAAIVGQGCAGRGFENKFRRQHDSRDLEILFSAIQNRGKFVTGL